MTTKTLRKIDYKKYRNIRAYAHLYIQPKNLFMLKMYVKKNIYIYFINKYENMGY